NVRAITGRQPQGYPGGVFFLDARVACVLLVALGWRRQGGWMRSTLPFWILMLSRPGSRAGRRGARADRGQPQHVEDLLGAQVGTRRQTSDEVIDHVPLSSCSKISASCARDALSGGES